MSRYVSIGLVALVVTWGMSTKAFAQRDSGAKARGDTAGFWDSKYNRSPTGSSVVAPSTTQGYRSFSYEPSTLAVRSQPQRSSRQPLLRGIFGRRSSANRVVVDQAQTINRGYRSFSFEPSAQSTTRVNRGQQASELWRYQKTDPRRYR
jgi:hypothetical protein